MRRLLVFVLAVTACERATAPSGFTLGPGCTHSLPIREYTLKAHYLDCTGHNIDSLEAVGWAITWDTVWHN